MAGGRAQGRSGCRAGQAAGGREVGRARKRVTSAHTHRRGSSSAGRTTNASAGRLTAKSRRLQAATAAACRLRLALCHFLILILTSDAPADAAGITAGAAGLAVPAALRQLVRLHARLQR